MRRTADARPARPRFRAAAFPVKPRSVPKARGPSIDTLLYDLLAVEPTATPDEIKLAHRAAAKRFHPDRGGDEARFLAVTRAYHVLSDPEKRRRYDETGLYDGAEADSLHADLIVTLSGALNHVLSRTALSLDSIDVVAEMRRLIEAGRAVAADDLAGLDARLEALRAARGRIKSRDGRENLFQLVIDGQIRRLSRLQGTKRGVLDAQGRALAELERYDSVVEMIRSVQPGLEPDGGGT